MRTKSVLLLKFKVWLGVNGWKATVNCLLIKHLQTKTHDNNTHASKGRLFNLQDFTTLMAHLRIIYHNLPLVQVGPGRPGSSPSTVSRFICIVSIVSTVSAEPPARQSCWQTCDAHNLRSATFQKYLSWNVIWPNGFHFMFNFCSCFSRAGRQSRSQDKQLSGWLSSPINAAWNTLN